jgi:hypothetical protein
MQNEKIDEDNATIEIRADWVAHRWMLLPFIKENGEWRAEAGRISFDHRRACASI